MVYTLTPPTSVNPFASSSNTLLPYATGLKRRRRILNRLRKTHSPEHAGRGGDEDGTGKASATRWSLIERYAKAAEEVEDIRPSTPVNGRLDTEL